MTEKLGRSSIEAYVSIGIAIVVVVFPLNFWVKLTLICVLACLLVDVAFRNFWMMGLHWG
jgi:hypothetical protein